MLSKRLAAAVTAERTSEDYAKNYYSAEAGMEGLFALDTKLLDSLVSKGVLFDATMGRGRHVLHFAKKLTVIGNDYNKHMVGLVKKDLQKQGLHAKLYNCDITKRLPLKDNSVDYVICMFSSLGAIPGSENRLDALLEFKRILRPGGLVIVHGHNRLGNFGNFRYLKSTAKMYLNREKDLELGDAIVSYGTVQETFIHIFSPREFRKMYESSGFTIKHEYYLNADQNDFYRGFMKKFKSGGMIFVGEK